MYSCASPSAICIFSHCSKTSHHAIFPIFSILSEFYALSLIHLHFRPLRPVIPAKNRVLLLFLKNSAFVSKKFANCRQTVVYYKSMDKFST